ncbi:MAG: FKBP-type peptidylprolyl isomerase [Planctomyces sp.]|nr:FKBP-type peptidylprolyl isomerase [Planctomyces sp.]
MRFPFYALTIGFAIAICGCASQSDLTESADLSLQPPIEEGPSPGPKAPTVESDAEWTTTESGLKYRILEEGSGEKPKKTDTVTVHYRGWLDNGTVFDTTYGGKSPATFPLSGVIPGWTEGLTYVAEGGEIELEIPAKLGYGSRQSGPIPPNSTLHFTVMLLEIE